MLRRTLLVLGAVALIMVAAPAQAIVPPDTHCERGKVALTFDDGPSEEYTPKLLQILRDNKAQATFFVQGHNVVAMPDLVRAEAADGHGVENHSWDHPPLTALSGRGVKHQLGRTQKAIQQATGRTPELFRPPYGATDRGVRRVARSYGLSQELWTIDTLDWTGRKPKSIRKAALRGLRPHESNVILMHDAVDNSGSTLKAVPGVIAGIRAKGYCLVPLQSMAPPAEVISPAIRVDEGVGAIKDVPVVFRLDGPAQRSGSFHLRSASGTAVQGVDFEALDVEVPVARGATSVKVTLRLLPDPMPNTARELSLRVSAPAGLHFASSSVPVTILDNDAWKAPVERLIEPTATTRATLAP